MPDETKKLPARKSSNLPVPASLVRDNPDIVKMLTRQLALTLIVPADVPRATMEAAATELVALMADIDPRDAIEGMLATQMVAAHNMAMDRFRRVAAVESVRDAHGAETNLHLADKLSKTFVRLSEALDRRRGRGPARVSVENVNVEVGRSSHCRQRGDAPGRVAPQAWLRRGCASAQSRPDGAA